MPPRNLVFVHIPKTAGISVSSALEEVMPSILGGAFDRSLFGEYADFDSLAPAARRLVYPTPDEPLPQGEGLVWAHMTLERLKSAYPDGRFFTVLREPICRLFSLWTYWRQQTPEGLAPWGSWANTIRKAHRPLAEFLADPQIACQTDNIYIRTLLGSDSRLPVAGFIDPRHHDDLVREATGKLDSLDFAGVIEDPQLWTRFSVWLQAPLDVKNRNPSRPMQPELASRLDTELTGAATTLLTERTVLDARLWRHLAARSPDIDDVDNTRTAALLSGTSRLARLLAPAG